MNGERGNKASQENGDLPPGWVWTTIDQCVDVLDHRRIPVNASDLSLEPLGRAEL